MRKPLQIWHYNHEDKYLKSNNVKGNNLTRLWVLNEICLIASPPIRLLTFCFCEASRKTV